MVRPLVTAPHVILRQKAVRVPDPTVAEIRQLIEDLKDTCQTAKGIGLAAPQIGSTARVCVIHYPTEREPYGLINPEVIAHSKGTSVLEEGCLSVNGRTVPVSRPKKVTVRAFDEAGKPIEIAAKDMLAKVLQHEIDHLNGRIITDYQRP